MDYTITIVLCIAALVIIFWLLIRSAVKYKKRFSQLQPAEANVQTGKVFKVIGTIVILGILSFVLLFFLWIYLWGRTGGA